MQKIGARTRNKMRAINACNKKEKIIILHFLRWKKEEKRNKKKRIKKEQRKKSSKKKGTERRDSNPSSYLQASPWTLSLLD